MFGVEPLSPASHLTASLHDLQSAILISILYDFPYADQANLLLYAWDQLRGGVVPFERLEDCMKKMRETNVYHMPLIDNPIVMDAIRDVGNNQDWDAFYWARRQAIDDHRLNALSETCAR